MSEHDSDLRTRSIELAIAAWHSEMGCSLVELADEIRSFLTGSQSEHTHDHHPKWAHDLVRGFVALSQKVTAMTAASDRLTASVASNTTAVADNTTATNAAIAAGIGGGTGSDPATDAAVTAAADATDANTAATQANTAALKAATPVPVV